MTDELSARRMLKLDARCPGCGRHPTLRVADIHAHAMRGFNPKATAMVYTCPWIGCGRAYKIPYRAFHRAA